MTRRHAFALALLAALAAPAAAQPTAGKDTADLFSADALVFVDLVKPAEVAREVTAFTKGTAIENISEFMAKWRAKLEDDYYRDAWSLAMMSAFAGPEMMGELSRIQGAAFVITGLDKDGDPEMVGVILPGQSNIPGFVMRVVMSMNPSMRPAGTVEGVTIFGEKAVTRRLAPAPPGAPAAPAAPPQPATEAPYYASMPGAIVVGSSLDNVSDVVRRLKGKATTPSLGATPAFKEFAALRARPGIFAYANPARGTTVLDSMFDSKSDAIIRRWYTELLNLKAIRGAAASLSLAEGTIDLRLAARLEPGKSSPLLDLFADQKATLQLMRPVPKDAIAAFSLTLGDGEKQFTRLLTVADAVVGNDGPKPGEYVKQIEATMKASLSKEIAGRLAAVTVAWPAKQELPKGATAVPMLFLTGTDAAAAEQLEKLTAPLVGAMLGEPVDPVTETIQGVKVRSLPAASFPWKAPLHYGRNGATLTIGADRKLVAASISGKLGDSLAGDPKVGASLPSQAAAGIGVWRWGNMLPDLLGELGQEQRFVNGRMQPADPVKAHEKVEKLRAVHADLIQKLPPLVVSIARRDAEFSLTVQQRHPGGTPGKLIEGLFDAVMGSATNTFERFAAPAQPAGPQPIKN